MNQYKEGDWIRVIKKSLKTYGQVGVVRYVGAGYVKVSIQNFGTVIFYRDDSISPVSNDKQETPLVTDVPKAKLNFYILHHSSEKIREGVLFDGGIDADDFIPVVAKSLEDALQYIQKAVDEDLLLLRVGDSLYDTQKDKTYNITQKIQYALEDEY